MVARRVGEHRLKSISLNHLTDFLSLEGQCRAAQLGWPRQYFLGMVEGCYRRIVEADVALRSTRGRKETERIVNGARQAQHEIAGIIKRLSSDFGI